MNTPSPTQGSRRMSAAQLARMLGVSAAAVSYALHGQPGVSDETRKRILAAAKQYDVRPTQPRNTTRDTAVLGVILADVSNPFYSEFAISVTDVAREQGHEVFLSHSRDENRAVTAAVTTMIHHRVDGVLLTAIQSGDGEVCRMLRAARIPFVQISRRMEYAEADFVGIDDRAAGLQIVGHLLEHGYRKFAIVGGPVSSTASATRAAGFREALSAAEIRLPRKWNITGGLNVPDGVNAARYLLELGELPEAVVCGTDAIALGLISELRSKGIRVPRDLAVTGFDGLTATRAHMIDLTTIIQPRRQMAQAAVDLVTIRLKRPNGPPQSILCRHGLYIGTSCGCSRKKGEQE